MKVAFVTDLHLEEDPETGALAGEQERVLSDLMDGVEAAKPDLILLGGDNSGHGIPHWATATERNAHAKLRVDLAAVAPVIEVMGNHDMPGDYSFFRLLRADNQIRYEEIRCGVDMASEGVDCVVWCFPWIYASEALAEEGVDHQGYLDTAVEEFVATALDVREGEIAAGVNRPHFVLAHIAVQGGVIRPGQPKVITDDPKVDPKELMLSISSGEDLFEAGFFGHYHHRQKFRIRGRDAATYGGSLLLTEYGEPSGRGWTSYSTKTRMFTDHIIKQRAKYKLTLDPTSGAISDIAPSVKGVESISDVRPSHFPGADVKVYVRVPPEGMRAHNGSVKRLKAAVMKSARSFRVTYARTAPQSAARAGSVAVASGRTRREKVAAYLAGAFPAGRGPTPEIIELAMSEYDTIAAQVEEGTA